jgi:hypothetical protein
LRTKITSLKQLGTSVAFLKGMTLLHGTACAVSRAFLQQSDVIATLWRLMRLVENDGKSVSSPLDGVAEPFIREVGALLGGEEGSAWARAQGTWRISGDNDTQALIREFSTLRRCMLNVVDALGGPVTVRQTVEHALDEATLSAIGPSHRLSHPSAPEPRAPSQAQVAAP